MAKMGLSAPANHLRPSPLCPPYFWFCRSYVHLSPRSLGVFYCLKDAVPKKANGLARPGDPNADLLKSNQRRRPSYSTFSDYQRRDMTHRYGHKMLPRQPRNDLWHHQSIDDEANGRVFVGKFGDTNQAWARAAQENIQRKEDFIKFRRISANFQTLSDEEIAQTAMPQKINIYEGEGNGFGSKEKAQHGQYISLNQRPPVSYTNPVNHVKLLDTPSITNGARPKGLENRLHKDSLPNKENVFELKETDSGDSGALSSESINNSLTEEYKKAKLREKLGQVYDTVFVVDSIDKARLVVSMLTTKYKDLIHACDTEVANIDVKGETPVDHGEVICFSIYPGPEADFGDKKSCIWVDVLDGGKDILKEFAPFFEDPSIKKVWHNYSFDIHVIENYGLKVSGFHADTMHMARLWNSSRRTEGGYSLEALTSDSKIMSDGNKGFDGMLTGKVSMKNIFGMKKLKKDGSEGKLITIPPVEELQRVERKLWISYSALDSISTLKLYESLERKLKKELWVIEGNYKGSMFENYHTYLRSFGELLVKMETEGMLVDRPYLAEIEKVAKEEQQIAADRFRKWASKYCADAKYMNIGSDTQLRQLFFGGVQNRKDPNEYLPMEKEFKVPNVDNFIEEGKKSPAKFRKIKLHKIHGVDIEVEKYTPSGWPSMSGDVLKSLAGKVSADFDFLDENNDELPETSVDDEAPASISTDTSAYGAAYLAFGGGQAGIEACHAIAALYEVCCIDSLISNFILPLQGNHISGKDGRIHCSLNINTETGRLSARRPNLQNQPALEKDRYKIRQAFIAAPGNSLIVADYGQLELRILAHLANCTSMLDAFKAGGDFHSRTAMNMYPHIRKAIEKKEVLLEWRPQSKDDNPPVPLLKDAFASERRKAKMLNFSIAYGKTTVGLARDWKVSREEAQETVDLWYSDRTEVLSWQEARKKEAHKEGCVKTLLGRARHFPSLKNASSAHRAHIERAAINTPVQGSAADVAMCAMLQISNNARLKELGWKLLLQVHDEVILEGPTESSEEAKAIVVDCMSKPFDGKNILRVGLSVDAKCAQNWYSAK